MKIKANGYQTAFDLSLIGYGSIEGLPLLVRDNPHRSITATTQFEPGEELNIISAPINRQVANQIQKKNIRPISKSAVSEGEWKDFNDDFNNDFR